MKTAGFLALGMALLPGLATATPVCEASSGAGTGALLELYTSEGCSSCPPADRWFGQLAATADPRRLSLLAFHVDYWDEIGWPDRFARHAYTERQSRRVRTGGSKTIYTPQLMLSTRLDLRWSDPERVSAALLEIANKPAHVGLHLRARPQPGQWHVDLSATSVARAGASQRVYLAMYENALSTPVKAGENAGVLLRHERVVRGFWGPWHLSSASATRALKLTPPKNAKLAQLGLTAFVQDERTGETLQALTLPLDGCALPQETPAPP